MMNFIRKHLYYINYFFSSVLMQVKQSMMYRNNFFIMIFVSLLGVSTGPIFQFLLFSQTRGYPGWTLDQIVFLQGMVLLITGVYATLVGSAKEVFIRYCHLGELDRLLLKPVYSLYFIFAEGFTITNIGSVAAGIVIVAISAIRLNINLTPVTVLLFIACLLASFLFSLALDILFFCITVFFIDTNRIIFVFTALRRFSNYPLELFSLAGQILLVTILPLSIIVYFPTQVLLNQSGLFLYIAAGSSVLWFVLVIFLWNITIKRYVNAGG